MEGKQAPRAWIEREVSVEIKGDPQQSDSHSDAPPMHYSRHGILREVNELGATLEELYTPEGDPAPQGIDGTTGILSFIPWAAVRRIALRD